MTVYELTITQSNTTVPSVPNDQYSSLTQPALYSVFQTVPFSIDMTLSLNEVQEADPPTDPPTPPTLVPVPISSVNATFTTYHSVSFTTLDTNPSAYKIRASGTITDTMPGESYDLLFANGTISTVPVTNLPSYRAIVKWNLPSSYSALISSYNFNINSGQYVATANQYVYWDFDTQIAHFKSVVAGGA